LVTEVNNSIYHIALNHARKHKIPIHLLEYFRKTHLAEAKKIHRYHLIQAESQCVELRVCNHASGIRHTRQGGRPPLETVLFFLPDQDNEMACGWEMERIK
jgi:hypothetical protein